MRDSIRKVINEELLTLPQVAKSLKISHAQIYRYVVDEEICDYERVGQSTVVIDKEDFAIVKERVDRLKALRIARKAKRNQ